LSPHPTRQPVGSGRVRVGSGRAYVKCRVPSGFSGFGSKFLARARPVSHTGSKILTRARPSNSSGRVGSGYFRAGWVGSVGSGSPCPGLVGDELQTSELEGLGRREQWRRRRSVAGDHGKLQGAESGPSRSGSPPGGEWSDRNHPIAEAVNAQSAPHGRCQTVAAENGRLLNYSIACMLCA